VSHRRAQDLNWYASLTHQCDKPCSGEVIQHTEFSMGGSPPCDLLSVRNGVSICAGFRLAKTDYFRNAKLDLGRQ
jgi:hypothetical protein